MSGTYLFLHPVPLTPCWLNDIGFHARAGDTITITEQQEADPRVQALLKASGNQALARLERVVTTAELAQPIPARPSEIPKSTPRSALSPSKRRKT